MAGQFLVNRRAYVGLGANLGAPAQQIQEAMRAITASPGLSVLARSRLYRSAPLGGLDQPDYCNAVMVLDIGIEPEALLDRLLDIERAAGRVRGGARWASRRLDLDLLHVSGVMQDTARLRLPHPGIASRNFVLAPLAEVAPELVIPELGAVAELAQRVGRQGLDLWPESGGGAVPSAARAALTEHP